MGKFKDITGEKFGRWTVIERYYDTNSKETKWLCQCSCGKEKIVQGGHLNSGKSLSCGCFSSETAKNNAKDHIGQKFGMLTAIEPTNKRIQRKVVWKCICDCGNEKMVISNCLVSGTTKSCGCMENELDITGNRYGRLIAISPSIKKGKNGLPYWKCVCDCGIEKDIPKPNLTCGRTKSCGCLQSEVCRNILTIKCDGILFRSKWEMYFYIASKIKKVNILYEKIKISVKIDGKNRKYTPDFLLVSSGEFIEIKGRKWPDGIEKLNKAIEYGNIIHLYEKKEIEKWCNCTLRKLDYSYKNYGIDGLNKLLNKCLL